MSFWVILGELSGVWPGFSFSKLGHTQAKDRIIFTQIDIAEGFNGALWNVPENQEVNQFDHHRFPEKCARDVSSVGRSSLTEVDTEAEDDAFSVEEPSTTLSISKHWNLRRRSQALFTESSSRGHCSRTERLLNFTEALNSTEMKQMK